MKNKAFFLVIIALASLLPFFGFISHLSISPTNTALDTGASISPLMPGSFDCSSPAPASFDGERTSETSASLSWSPVSGVVAYRLKIYNINTEELISNTLEYGASKNVTNFANGVAYRCVLASVCIGGATSDFVIIVDIL